MSSYERLTAQDASFLHIETSTSPMHVGSLGIFEGAPFFDDSHVFRLDDVRRLIASRLDRVPRFRRRLMNVPLAQGRPVWVDDDRFDLGFHVRHTALPRPGSEEQLKALMARLQATPLDRRRPLWEMWFVEGLEGDRVALIQKTHHALIDGISGVDVAMAVLDVDSTYEPEEPAPWTPQPAPSPAQLLAESLVERATQPAELVRSARAAVRGPRRVTERAVETVKGVARLADVVPRTSLNVPVGPHRRFEMVRVPLEQAKAIKNKAGGTVNDVVLAAVAGGYRRLFETRSESVDSMRIMIPVSIRDDSERMLLGNRVSAIFADLPVGVADPLDRLHQVTAQTRELKDTQQAITAETLMQVADYAPPLLLSLAGRLLPRQRSVNTGITNVPGPQFPLYCMGARMLEAFPYVGVVDSVAVVNAVLSYDGQLGFGLTGDRDAVPDLGVLAEGIEKSFTDLAGAAGAS